MRTYVHSGVICLAVLGGAEQAAAQLAPDPKIEQPVLDPLKGAIAPAAQVQLTPEQKIAIFNAVRQAGAKVNAPPNVPATIGAQVPPVIELYVLPDSALAVVPEAKGVKFTIVENQVVLVDPTTMRVVDIIGQ